MTNLVYPCKVHNVSDSFQDHVNRHSVNPGTDYTASYGDEVYAVMDGTVMVADGNPDGSGGRTICIYHPDGSSTDYLHLSALAVSVGQHVSQGQRIAWSGGSGDGENQYNPATGGGYAPHLHISYRPHNQIDWFGNVGNADFDAAIRAQGGTDAAGGGGTPISNDEGDEFVTVFYATSTAGYIFQGWRFLQGPDGTLKAFSSFEWQAYSEAHPGVKVVERSGQDIYNLSLQVGLWEFTGTQQTGPKALTGRLIGRSADLNNESGSDFRHFPRVEQGTWPAKV